MIIKASTTDEEIATKLTTEEILGKFHAAKAYSNRWSAESDRLRKFIQKHIESGRYGAFILEKSDGTPRVQATKQGNAAIQSALIIDVGIVPPKTTPGQEVWVINKDGETIAEGSIVDNKLLFSKNPPKMVKLTEVPDESTTT